MDMALRKHVIVLSFALSFLLVCTGISLALQERLRVMAGKTSYELGGRPLESGTVTIRTDDTVLSEGEDYDVDLFAGKVTLYQEFSAGTILLITYEISGDPFLSYSLSEVLPVVPIDSAVNRDKDEEIDTVRVGKRKRADLLKLPSSNLSISGEKVLSMEVSAGQGAVLAQSLDLSMGGSITDGTDLSVYLSDNTMPVESDGSSKEVRELDRVSVSVTNPSGDATVGAYVFELDDYELVSVRKNLEGFTGSVRRDGYSVGGSGAISGGDFTTNTFQGAEGKQGPYLLTDGSGRSSIVVIAGSEKVYLDGRLLQRGSRGDYTINYNDGTLTFTDRNMITSYSRIEVEFEYASASYKKSFLATRGSLELTEHTRLKGFMMRENDQASSPVSGDFSDSDMTLLTASDGDGEVLLPGGKHVGEGEGDYILIDAGSVSEHYEYVGPGKGDYRVSFTAVGRGEGDYTIDTATSHFVYLGDSLGDYIAARKVKTPQRRLTGGASFRYEEPKRFHLGGEGFISSIDKNTFSSGSGSRDAFALDLGGGLQGQEVRISERELGVYSMSFSERYLGKGFDVPGRLYEADFHRRWGLSALEGDCGENLSTTTFGYSWPGIFDVDADLGFLDRGNGDGSRRRGVVASLNPFQGTELTFERESAAFVSSELTPSPSRGNMRRTKTGASQKLGQWITIFQNEQESRVEPYGESTLEEGRRRSTMRATVKGPLSREVGLEVSAGSEVGKLRNSGNWRDWMRATEAELELSYSGKGANSLNAHLTHRRTRFLTGSQADFNTTIGRLEYFNFPSSGRHRTHLSYELTNTSRVTSRVAFLPERNASEGEYLEDGTYVGREEGTHRREILGGSEIGERTIKVSLSGVQSTDLDCLLPEGSSLSGLTLNSTFHLVEENNAVSDRGLFLFTSGNRFSKQHSVYSENNLREELEARWNSKGLTAKFEFLMNRLMDNRYENLSGGRLEQRSTLYLRSRSQEGLELGLELGKGKEEREVAHGLDRVRFVVLAGDIGYQMNEKLRFSLEVKGENRTLYDDYGARLFGVSPGLTRFFRSRGRLHIDVEITRVSGKTDNYFTTLWLLKGKEFGLNSKLGVEGEYRIGRSLLFLARLSFRKKADQNGMTSSGNTELRYIF